MKTLILALSFLFSLPSFSMVIKGKVIDPTGNPLMGALVRVKETNDAQTTSFRGTFSISFNLKEPVSSTVVVVVVNSMDYEEKKITIDYKADGLVDLGTIQLGFLVDEDVTNMITPNEFSKLPEIEVLEKLTLLTSVDFYSSTEGTKRDFSSYQEEIMDLSAFENISKKELKYINGMVDDINGKVASIANPEEITISVLIKSDKDRTIYGYEALFENLEEEDCHYVFSAAGDLLAQKCESVQ